MSINCWEAKKCGREPGGEKVDEMGECPAATDPSLNTMNNGQNGGRVCWYVAGTLCQGEKQGTYAQKLVNCLSCDFFQLVKQEESGKFTLKPQ